MGIWGDKLSLCHQQAEKAPEDSSAKGMMTVRIKVEQPDIALVEDMSSINTSCIILHVSWLLMWPA